MNIVIIPTVQYSPSLNGVAEGYFGIIKEHSYINSANKRYISVMQSIKSTWKNISDNNFDGIKCEQLYFEWIQRIQACKRGEPLYTCLLSEDKIVPIDHVKRIKVNSVK